MCPIPPDALNVLQNTFQQTGFNMLGNAAFRIASPKDAAIYGVVSSCAQSALPIASEALAKAILNPGVIESVFAPHAETLTVRLSVAVLNRLASTQIAVSAVNCFKPKGEQKLSLLNGLSLEAAGFGIEQAVKMSLN